MRAPSFPPCVIERRGAWRWGIAALGATAAASTAAWLAVRFDLGAMLPASAAALLAVRLALRATRLPPLELGFDGNRWTIGGHEGGGHVEVVVDIGSWMLLRYVASDLRGGERWLPVSRARLGSRWHALRCAACAGVPGTADDGKTA